MSAGILPRDPVAGTCSAIGIANIKYKAPAHFYTAVFLTARVDGGTPNWIVSSSRGGVPLAFAAGRNVTIGPVYLDAGEQINIAVNGADPNAKVIGQMVGFQADTIEELVETVAQLPGSFSSRNVVDPNPVVRISATSAHGQPNVSVADVTPFHVDQLVDVSQIGLGSTTAVVLAVTPNDPTGSDPSGVLQLNGNLNQDYTTAGWVMVLTVIGVYGQPIGVTTTVGGVTTPLAMNVTQWGSAGTSLGQKVAAQSVPVVLASDQLPLNTNVSQFGGAAITQGQKVMASSMPVVIASDQSLVPVNLSQFGSAGISQGQKVSASSMPVVIASDQSAFPVQPALARQTAFANSSRAIGTYTFDCPDNQGASGVIVYFVLTSGAGNVTLTVSRHDVNVGGSGTGADSGLLTSAAISSPSNGSLAVYPGIAVVANVTASQNIGRSPRLTAVVATNSLTFGADLDNNT